MDIIHSKQLFPIFFKSLKPYYVLVGNNDFFIQESKKIIFSIAQKNGFLKTTLSQIQFQLKSNTIISTFKNNNLFSKKKIIILHIPQNTLTAEIQKQLSNLSIFLNSNLLLIIQTNISKYMPNNIWFKIFQLKGTIIRCENLLNQELSVWTQNKIHDLKINIQEDAIKLLLKVYKNNIEFLYNSLNVLKLIWPNSLIDINNVKNIISNEAIFTLEEWIDTILIGNFEKSVKILNNFYIKNNSYPVLLRSLQNNLLAILMIKRQKFTNFINILTQFKISKHRHSFLINIARHKSLNNINRSIKLLMNIEINVKKKHTQFIWNQLKILLHIISQNN
ncbi:hypothetical protein XW81_02020 [Buchnera aphidicola (Schlechtendalia chinensis)]|uniref:DNA polymerase III subunit delta n=1 Tax=Buchnera aphidicola subsp. Schlechtendalia chinensis TaxID=118110 RepID=A0A172WDX5_BUCSC|nr:DNA polymerase III subunit delta [Buchnera aphidicola]ANF17161.1 hypothetical protein XW81_02020 [Buchnera aphidicola (Schlechtendalia chinensis)]